MKKYVKFIVPLIMVSTIFATAPVQAKGFFEQMMGKMIPPIKIHIDVWNHTDQAVRVIMDTNRESHDIAPHSMAKFTANLGDFPTFHFMETQSERNLGSKTVKMTGNSTIEWHG